MEPNELQCRKKKRKGWQKQKVLDNFVNLLKTMRTKSQGMIKAKDGLTGERTYRHVLRLYKRNYIMDDQYLVK